MAAQPTGTVTLLFTDVEGSTRLLERLGMALYAEALELHRRLLREAFSRRGGYEVDYEGDAFFVAFARAGDAVAAALEAQRALACADWPEEGEIRVRMGLHTGEPMPVPPKYVGLDVHKAARIMAAGHGGQVLVSAATKRLIGNVEVLPLGEHRLKDLLQPEPLYQLRVPGLPQDFPALKTLGNRPNNLPTQPNPLVGREREVADVVALLGDADMRLVTLTGPGGTGKTRLALQVGAELLDDFESGVFFASLAAIRDPALVVPTIAQALAVREVPGEELADTLASYLEQKRMLLVLDNFEQVIDAAVEVARLLDRCSRMKLVVTSRERLRLQGERTYAVPPLPLVHSAADIDAVLANDAVALFAARARAATGDFTLDAGDASTVAEICARLDGLPLAIELAAARVPVLPPKAILRRLDQRLPLLTGGRRDQDERQRTLRATIEWSYELLTPAEQGLFARLGVFVGGCRLNAAESVCDPDRELGIDVVDGISSLLHKSLLRRRDDPDGEPRFSMLETIREYAEERLSVSEEADSIRNRAIDAAVDFAIAAEPGWRSPDGSVWRRRFPLELSNLRQAMALAHTAGTPERALLIASHLTWLWQIEGFVHEGIGLVERALAECGGQLNAESRGLALACIGVLAGDQGDTQRSFGALEEASPLLKPTRPDLWVYLQYRMAGLCALADPGRAAHMLVGADEEAEALDDDLLRVAILEARASLAAQHDLATARVLASTGVDLTRAHHPGAHLSLLAALADYEAADGDYDSARSTVAEAEAVAEREDLSWELARVYRVAALIAIIVDDLPEAIARRDRLAEYVASSERLPDRLALALVEAGLAAKAETPREAIVAWAHADTLRDSLDIAWEAMEKQLVERVLEPLRQQVHEADFREAWEAACGAALDGRA